METYNEIGQDQSYSQMGQDHWVLSLFPKGHQGFFIDVGCHLPEYINNTLLLEENGWYGVAFDKKNYRPDWKKRRTTKFILADVLFCNLMKANLPNPIDYMSLDIDGEGTNYTALKRFLDLRFEFKVITIEHNFYFGEEYDLAERIPQRQLLSEKGYTRVYSDVSAWDENAVEDWWINKKYIDGLDTRGKI